MAWYVYYSFNKLFPNKAYIGMTKNPISSGYKGSGRYIHSALQKYGKENFVRIDLGEFNDKDEAHFWEGFYIKLYKTEVKYGGYNISPTGGLGTPGCLIHTEETKRKIGIGSRNTRLSESSETKQKRRESLIGRIMPPNTYEQKRKISETLKGIKRSDETKQLMSKSRLGKKMSPLSDEHKGKLREAALKQWEKQKSII